MLKSYLKPKITLITTIRHNVGDDFVREGIRAILDSICDYHTYCIHKHKAALSCANHEPEDEGPPLRDKILEADIIINAGAPVYWNLGSRPGYKCANECWIEPLWYRRISRIHHSRPILNLAAGACQGYFGLASEITGDRECSRFIRDVHALCRLTVVRDSLAEDVNSHLGLAVSRTPCTSIHSWRRHPRPQVIPNRIALNFMPLGGHYEIGASIDRERWARSFLEIDRLLRSAGFEVAPVAHSESEREALRSLLPGRSVFYSCHYRDYFSFYGQCAGGILNRVHGAMLLAGLASPAIVIGNDSRSRTVDEMRLPRYYINDVRPKEVVERLAGMLRDKSESRSLRQREAKAFADISALVKRSITGWELAEPRVA